MERDFSGTVCKPESDVILPFVLKFYVRFGLFRQAVTFVVPKVDFPDLILIT